MRIFAADLRHSKMSLKESGFKAGGRSVNRNFDLLLVTLSSSVTFNPVLYERTWKPNEPQRNSKNLSKESIQRILAELQRLLKSSSIYKILAIILITVGFSEFLQGLRKILLVLLVSSSWESYEMLEGLFGDFWACCQ